MNYVKLFVKIPVLIVGLFLFGCSSAPNPPFNAGVSVEMQKLEVQDSFRFYVSTNVELRRSQVVIEATSRNTVVRQNITNDVIRLNKNTTGRAFSFDGESIWIYFEPADRNGTYKTIRFILKPKDPNQIKSSDLFYFYYQRDAEIRESIDVAQSGQRTIRRTEVVGDLIAYGKDENGNEILYEVSFSGNEEPYLLYIRDTRETTKTRVMRGVS